MLKNQSYVELMQQMASVGCSQKALIITCDGDLRGLLTYALESYGMYLQFCQGDAEALAFSMIDSYDCVIIDCDTDGDGMDGIELVRRLREQSVFTILIGLSKEDRGAAYLQAGANDFLQKPFVPYRLAMMLDGGDIPA